MSGQGKRTVEKDKEHSVHDTWTVNRVLLNLYKENKEWGWGI